MTLAATRSRHTSLLCLCLATDLLRAAAVTLPWPSLMVLFSVQVSARHDSPLLTGADVNIGRWSAAGKRTAQILSLRVSTADGERQGAPASTSPRRPPHRWSIGAAEPFPSPASGDGAWRRRSVRAVVAPPAQACEAGQDADRMAAPAQPKRALHRSSLEQIQTLDFSPMRAFTRGAPSEGIHAPAGTRALEEGQSAPGTLGLYALPQGPSCGAGLDSQGCEADHSSASHEPDPQAMSCTADNCKDGMRRKSSRHSIDIPPASIHVLPLFLLQFHACRLLGTQTRPHLPCHQQVGMCAARIEFLAWLS